MVIIKKYKCLGCSKFINDDPYDLCDYCKQNLNREPSEIEKEYGMPQSEEIPDYDWDAKNQEEIKEKTSNHKEEEITSFS